MVKRERFEEAGFMGEGRDGGGGDGGGEEGEVVGGETGDFLGECWNVGRGTCHRHGRNWVCFFGLEGNLGKLFGRGGGLEGEGGREGEGGGRREGGGREGGTVVD